MGQGQGHFIKKNVSRSFNLKHRIIYISFSTGKKSVISRLPWSPLFFLQFYNLQFGWFPVTTRPEPSVKWICNGEPVEENDNIKFDHSTGVYHLKINKVENEHSGQWKCVAKNEYGQTSCSCELTVLGKQVNVIGQGHCSKVKVIV